MYVFTLRVSSCDLYDYLAHFCVFFYYLNPDKYALDSVFAFKVTSGRRVSPPDKTFEIIGIFFIY